MINTIQSLGFFALETDLNQTICWYTILSTTHILGFRDYQCEAAPMASEEYQNIVKKTFQDPITDLLLKNSSLTRIQFETLVIDMLTDIMSDEKISFKQKTLFRGKKVSRGSFSRSLSQARRNVISSIFTIVLLSYIGVFEARPFDEYYVLAEKLKEYLSLIESRELKASRDLLKQIENELIEGIDRLAAPTSIKIV